jgi:hypothetical protein
MVGMLVRETGTDRADASAVAAAARALCEQLARTLAPLIGDAGVAAICARALYLVKRQFPGLAPARAANQGEGPFAHLQTFLEHQEPAVAMEAAVAVLTTVFGLLASFVGESLTARLLRDAWPDDFAGETTEETTT